MFLSGLAPVVLFSCSTALAINLKVASSGGNVSSPLMYGLMFEDINHSGDGGLYAELIQNRAFQGSSVFPSTIFPWEAVGGASLSLENLTTPVSSALPTSLQVSSNSTHGTVGILNPGWFGIDVKPQTYTGSFFVLGEYTGKFTASLQSVLTNETFASVDIPAVKSAGAWTQYNFTLEPRFSAPNSNNSLVLTFNSAGVSGSSLSFNLISLFPPTFNNRPNGLRIDLMEALQALNPSFLRMPGGNNLEGNSAPFFFQWNQTIGPLVDRPGYPGTWGYTNTLGLGLTEYLFWCEDLKMEPILAVWSGLYLDGVSISEEELGVYIQDALDELEFVMGDPSTEFGALRVSLGYPEQGWPVKYVEIGNEDNLNDGQDSYSAYRFAAFYHAISAKWPELILVASTINTQAGDSAGDFHDYTRPDDFVNSFNLFDNANAEVDHKSLLGEYACIQQNSPTQAVANFSEPRSVWPTWICSIAEAVYTLGAERNTNKILGASYAPGFQNLNSYQWAPDMISFTADPAQNVLSTSYQVIKLLSTSRFSKVLPTTSDSGFSPAFWVAGVMNDGKNLLKVAIYNTTTDVPISISFDDSSASSAELVVLTAPSPFSNSTIGIDVVNTEKSTIKAHNGIFSFSLPEYSIATLTTQ